MLPELLSLLPPQKEAASAAAIDSVRGTLQSPSLGITPLTPALGDSEGLRRPRLGATSATHGLHWYNGSLGQPQGPKPAAPYNFAAETLARLISVQHVTQVAVRNAQRVASCARGENRL